MDRAGLRSLHPPTHSSASDTSSPIPAAFFSIGSVIIASGVAVAAVAAVLYPFFGELRRANY